MRAKVTTRFAGVPDGQTHPRRYEPDDIVEGNLAEVAVKQEWAERLPDAPEAPTPAKSSRSKPRARRTK